MDPILITAFTVGLLGAVHCLGMCGGIVGALSFNLSPKIQLSLWRMFPYHLAYNVGRITSYALVGALFGYLGSSAVSIAEFLPMQLGLQVIAGVFMILLGLYIGGWWNGIVAVESVGAWFWHTLQPLAKRMSSVQSLRQAWLYGLVWGWLPCGLVYSMLIMALSSGSAGMGALTMVAFGIGTLPNLLLMGSFAFFFTRLSRNIWVRRLAGFLILVLGCWQLWWAFHLNVSA